MYRFETEEGFSAGLIIWGVFTVVFFLLRIPAGLSILLGLFAGIAVGVMIAYWRAEKVEDTKKREKQEPEAIRPIRRLVEQLPVLRVRPRLPSPFRPKPPRRIGKD